VTGRWRGRSASIPAFVAAHGRPPSTTEIIKLRQRATLETRPLKEHRPLGAMTEEWRQRADRYVGTDPQAWVVGLSDRNDLPLLRAGDLADEILSDAAAVTIHKVSERRATFSRANVLAEVHRQFHGVRFASPDDRIAVAERTADLATGQSLLISAPDLHFTPEHWRRADGTSRFLAKGHENRPQSPKRGWTLRHFVTSDVGSVRPGKRLNENPGRADRLAVYGHFVGERG
jgi:hypothetical protein